MTSQEQRAIVMYPWPCRKAISKNSARDETADDSANCICDCNYVIRSWKHQWWAYCKQLQWFCKLRNINFNDFPTQKNMIAIEPRDLCTQLPCPYTNFFSSCNAIQWINIAIITRSQSLLKVTMMLIFPSANHTSNCNAFQGIAIMTATMPCPCKSDHDALLWIAKAIAMILQEQPQSHCEVCKSNDNLLILQMGKWNCDELSANH